MGAISLRLPDDLERKLSAEAKLSGQPRSALIREALAEMIERRERERYMAEYVAEAEAGYRDPELRREAIEMAEEAVATGNEALDIAEGRAPGEPWPEELGERWWKRCAAARSGLPT